MTNVQAYMYGGNSRYNSSFSAVAQNAGLKQGGYYELDMSSDVMLIMVPDLDQWNTKFAFTYTVNGNKVVAAQESWWKSLINGPNG